ncbi:hypothetical protein BGZ92_006870, partial [Podila epicladia]
MILLCGLLSLAAANPPRDCSASGKKQVCCNGLANCLIQAVGENCSNEAFCCETKSPTGITVLYVNLLNCVKL